MATRVTQIAVEALDQNSSPNARVTQVAVEVLDQSSSPAALVTQVAVEVLILANPNLVVSQTGLEVARSGDPSLVVSGAGIEVAWQPPKGTFTANARLVYDDGYPDRKSNWFTVGSHLKKTFPGSFSANAVITRTMPVAGATFTAEAWLAGRFFLDAALGNWFQAPIDAVIKTTFVSNGQEVLRPISDLELDGVITYSTGSTGWNLVDEVTLDTSDWYMPAYRPDTGFFSSSYLIHRFPQTGVPPGSTISSVAIFGNAQNMGAPAYKLYIVVRNPATGTLYRVLGWDQNYIAGPGLSSTAEGSVTLATRPWDSQPWTTADVNAIKIGGNNDYNHAGLTRGRLARLYAVVTWTRVSLVASAVLLRTQGLEGVSPLKTFTANAIIKRTISVVGPFPTVTESGGQSTGTTLTLTLPSFSTGDLLICYGTIEPARTLTWTYVSSTSSFTPLILDNHQSTTDARYRVMQAGDSGDLVITHSTSAQLAYSFFVIPAGTFSGTPEAWGGYTSYTSQPDPPIGSPSWGSANTLWLALSSNYNPVTSYPANYTQLGFQSGNVAVASAYRQRAAATEDPGTFTWQSAWYTSAWTIAIRPADRPLGFPVEYRWGPGGSFTVAGIRKKTIAPAIPPATAGFYVAAYKSGRIDLDAEIVPRRFWLYAQVGYFFRIDAEIVPRRFPSDAVIQTTFDQDSFSAAAVKLKTATGSKTISAVIKRTMPVAGATFTAEAWLAGRFSVSAYVSPYFRADAVVLFPGDMVYPLLGFPVEAWVVLFFRVDAFIQPYFRADADIEFGFMVNAVIRRSMGAPTFLPLSYPGTSQTLLGQTANVLSPVVPIDSFGDQLSVTIGSPPSDGSSLTAFSVTGILRYDIGVTPGEHSLSVIPGRYYIVSAKDNVYRPSLTGSGSYSDWAVSSLTFTVAAFIQPTFRVDAAIVWHWEFPPGTPVLTAAAWKMDRVVSSFKADTWIQPFFFVGAEVVPRHFHMDAWIKCEFRVNAWIIRKVTGSLTANAFIRGYFRVNAVRKKTQLKTFTVGAFKTAPHFGSFSIDSWVLAHFSIGASFRLTKYRQFTVAAWRIFKISSSFPVNAYIKTYFYANADVYRPAEFIDPIPYFLVEAKLVKLVFGDFAVEAFVDGWFAAKAIKGETFERAFLVKAAIIWKRTSPTDYDPFWINASITGFQVNAVLKSYGGVGIGGRAYVFNVYALKSEAHPTKIFLAQAEKSDPGAYWDPFTETWQHMHFLVDAWVLVRRLGSFNVMAALIDAGTPQLHFLVDAWVRDENRAGEFLLEADVVSRHFTVVYDGQGSTKVVRNLVTEPLSFPGERGPLGTFGNLSTDDYNLLYGPFRPIDMTPVTITLWEYPFDGATWLDIRSANEQNGLYGVLPAASGSHVFWPSYYFEDHYVWAYNQVVPAYNPSLTGSGLISFYRDDTVTLSLPAPTLDAWVVGTTGTPFTINAEVIGRTKLRAFAANAEIFGVGETRGMFEASADILKSNSYHFYASAEKADLAFGVDASIFQPSFSLDACFGYFFRLKATILATVSQSPVGPKLDAFIVVPQKASAFTVAADIAGVGERHNFIAVDSLILGPRVKRIYLAAYIGLEDKAFSLAAVIGYRFTVGSWVGSEGGGMGGFHANAYIRGSAYIIFPADGGPKTDPYGNPPMIGRSFKVKIEAFIPDPIPMGNDPEIERLILLILEAEAELEAMYCAYTHYTPQDSTATTSPSSYQSHPAPSGGGYTGSSLPNTISQIGYLGAGDIDDCWCVATIWAAKAAGVPDWHVSVTEYRHWARNPDRPGSTGGTLDHVIRGARGCWPNAKVRRYRSTSWDGFISLLKAGWIGSLAVRCSALPSRLRYGFKGLHQVGVAYHNGKYYIADPLAPNGSRPKEITGAEMRKAARGFVGGTICAALIS